jgi:hypothetical protein
LDSFTFLEHFDSDQDTPAFFNNKQYAFIGNNRIFTGAQDQTSDLLINISCSASNEFLTEQITYDTSSSSLSLILPSPPKGRTHYGCLAVNVSMFFRPNLSIDSLSIATEVSDIKVMPGVDLVVRDTTDIALRAGTLTASPLFASRKTYIDVDAGSVKGEYGLYDILAISTKAGSIRADVIPKPIDEDNPATADLVLSTMAGSIGIAFPPANTSIPERDYYTTVKAQQGPITGNYIHGKFTALSTNAGPIIAKLLPFFNGDSDSARISTLSTTTDAGSQDIELLSPYKNVGSLIHNMSSQHLTGFASLKIKYPSEWEGFIDGKTSVGSLKLDGSKLRIIEEGQVGIVGRYVKAERGDGDNELKFKSAAGSAKAIVG